MSNHHVNQQRNWKEELSTLDQRNHKNVMRYISVCSGIEAATVAWHPLGWEAVAFSEIEPFPCKVLAHHYPDVPNYGDMTKFKEWPNANIDVLVGGTPCQSFSVAGLRKGLDDPRGNLMLTYLAIADKYRPKYIVWENVPGVLSSNGGRDFGTFLGGLGKLGYGFSYRVLDAQYCRTDGYPYAVPQRRRRVFVVGCLGDWRSAAAILFDSESLRGNSPPSRKAGKEVAGTIGARASGGGGLGTDFECNGGLQPVTCMSHGQANAEICEGYAPTLNCNHEQPIAFALAGNTIGREPENGGNGTGYDETGSSYTLTKTDVHAVAFNAGNSSNARSIGYSEEHTPPLRAGASGTNQVPTIAFGIGEKSDVGHCLRSGASKADKHESTTYIAQAFNDCSATLKGGSGARGYPDPSDGNGHNIVGSAKFYQDSEFGIAEYDTAGTLRSGRDPHHQMVAQPLMQVRRLTPTECERLQAFPDGYTNIPGSSDSARYKALGNSMACNVMQLIGQRIQMAEDLCKKNTSTS